MDSEVP